MRCPCGNEWAVGGNGRCRQCNSMAGYKGHQTRMRNRRVADYQTGVEARIAKARARLAHDPNVDPVDPAAGDVVVSVPTYAAIFCGMGKTPVSDAMDARCPLLYSGRRHIEGFRVSLVVAHEDMCDLSVAGMGYSGTARNGNKTRGQENRHREALSFSPHCLKWHKQEGLFA